jgi:hypothetical protein
VKVMREDIPFGRSFAAFLATLAAAAFVHLHSLLQANLLEFGYKFRMNALPFPPLLYHRFSTAGYVLPAVALASFLMNRSQKLKNIIRQETLLVTAGMVSLLWLLGCILAWQLPWYTPVEFIK